MARRQPPGDGGRLHAAIKRSWEAPGESGVVPDAVDYRSLNFTGARFRDWEAELSRFPVRAQLDQYLMDQDCSLQETGSWRYLQKTSASIKPPPPPSQDNGKGDCAYARQEEGIIGSDE